MKLLLFMTHAGYARNFEWALRLLAERGHELNVVLEEPAKPNVSELLDRLVEEYPNVTAEPSPPRADPESSDVSARIRAYLDYLQYLHPDLADADPLRERAARRLPGPLVTALNLRALRGPRAQRAIRRLVAAAYGSLRPDPGLMRFIAERRPDAVLITPLVAIASRQADHLDAARAAGVPAGVIVASWDNLHSKGLIHRVPELVTVWNDAMRREAVELHGLPAERVVVTGAVAYDHWYEWEPSRSREAFCEAVGLDPARPFLLYVGSGRFIAPGEADFALRCINGIRNGAGAGLGDLQVLVRPHPQNPMRGEGAGPEELETLDDVVIYPPAGIDTSAAQSRQDYFDSIYHCAAVFGISTSAFLEAAILDRPVHSVLVGEYAAAQSGVPMFRVMRPENRGMLALAGSIDELAHDLAASLRDPGPARTRNRAFRDHFLRPAGHDVASSPRLVEAIERLPELPRVPAESSSAAMRLAGRVLASAVRRRRGHARRQAELERIGAREWREELSVALAEER
jgi:hypothetical protein